MRSGESAVISHEMQFISPHLLMKRRKMRGDKRSSHTILASVEFFLPPDEACEVLQKPVLPRGAAGQGAACLNHFGGPQNDSINVSGLRQASIWVSRLNAGGETGVPPSVFTAHFHSSKSDDCLISVMNTPRASPQRHKSDI